MTTQSKSGYLYVATVANHPNKIRISISTTDPYTLIKNINDKPNNTNRLRIIWSEKSDDIEAAIKYLKEECLSKTSQESGFYNMTRDQAIAIVKDTRAKFKKTFGEDGNNSGEEDTKQQKDSGWLYSDGISDPTGPVSEEIISERILSGLITRDCLAWSKGQEEWKRIIDIETFSAAFLSAPPSLPNKPPPHSPKTNGAIQSKPISDLNIAQRNVLVFCGAALILAFIYPPNALILPNGALIDETFSFIWNIPESHSIRIPLLFVEWIVIGITGSIIFILSRNTESARSNPIANTSFAVFLASLNLLAVLSIGGLLARESGVIFSQEATIHIVSQGFVWASFLLALILFVTTYRSYKITPIHKKSLAEPKETLDDPDNLEKKSVFLQVFIEKNIDYYHQAFKKIELGGSSWNWPGFLFGILWLFYRKLYAKGLIFLSIVNLSILVHYKYVASSGLLYLLDALILVWIPLGVIIASQSNGWLYSKYKNAASQLEQVPNKEQLRIKGGVSNFSAGVMLMITVLFQVFIIRYGLN